MQPQAVEARGCIFFLTLLHEANAHAACALTTRPKSLRLCAHWAELGQNCLRWDHTCPIARRSKFLPVCTKAKTGDPGKCMNSDGPQCNTSSCHYVRILMCPHLRAVVVAIDPVVAILSPFCCYRVFLNIHEIVLDGRRSPARPCVKLQRVLDGLHLSRKNRAGYVLHTHAKTKSSNTLRTQTEPVAQTHLRVISPCGIPWKRRFREKYGRMTPPEEDDTLSLSTIRLADSGGVNVGGLNDSTMAGPEKLCCRNIGKDAVRFSCGDPDTATTHAATAIEKANPPTCLRPPDVLCNIPAPFPLYRPNTFPPCSSHSTG